MEKEPGYEVGQIQSPWSCPSGIAHCEFLAGQKSMCDGFLDGRAPPYRLGPNETVPVQDLQPGILIFM